MSNLATSTVELAEVVVRQPTKSGDLAPGDVVQLDPETVLPRRYGGCFMIVDSVAAWGATGHLLVPGFDRLAADSIQIRVAYEHMVKIGVAEWKKRP